MTRAMDAPASPALDRAALDAAYDNQRKIGREAFAAFLSECAQASERARRQHRCVLDLPFGPSPAERLDVFGGGSSGAPVSIFFHGGYWRMLDKRDFGYVANGVVPHGHVLVVVNYALLPGVRMDTLIAQCRRAVRWTCAHIEAHGGDPTRVNLFGHSAGGHITAMMLADDGTAAPDAIDPDAIDPAAIDPAAITGACSLSGIFDLDPIQRCFLNDVLALQDDEVQAFSPVRLPRRIHAPLRLAVGQEEGAEYLRQSAELARAWGKPQADNLQADNPQADNPHLWCAPGHDHFTIRAALGDPAHAVTRYALGL